VIVERTRFDRGIGWRSVAEESARARVRAISFFRMRQCQRNEGF
jgi:hypothetical protein